MALNGPLLQLKVEQGQGASRPGVPLTVTLWGPLRTVARWSLTHVSTGVICDVGLICVQGSDCLKSFGAMQDCMKKHPEAFAEFINSKEEFDAVVNTPSGTLSSENSSNLHSEQHLRQ